MRSDFTHFCHPLGCECPYCGAVNEPHDDLKKATLLGANPIDGHRHESAHITMTCSCGQKFQAQRINGVHEELGQHTTYITSR